MVEEYSPKLYSSSDKQAIELRKPLPNYALNPHALVMLLALLALSW